ncbi:MAG: hypothetical protein KGM99_12070 [Burkholderiales bacterium]|nr:hypothetical protein [Burkholderiales bacterium]
MKRSRSSRSIVAFILLNSMLFMQLVVAGYACAIAKTVIADTSYVATGMRYQGMAGCKGMDQQQSDLCHAHIQVKNQSLDKPNLPQVQPFLATKLVATFHFIDVAYRPTITQLQPLELTRSVAPPLSIRNCCFRI